MKRSGYKTIQNSQGRPVKTIYVEDSFMLHKNPYFWFMMIFISATFAVFLLCQPLCKPKEFIEEVNLGTLSSNNDTCVVKEIQKVSYNKSDNKSQSYLRVLDDEKNKCLNYEYRKTLARNIECKSGKIWNTIIEKNDYLPHHSLP